MSILHTNQQDRDDVIEKLNLSQQTKHESMARVLEEWKVRANKVASLDALIYGLKVCKLAESAEALRNKYYQQDNRPSQKLGQANKTSKFGCGLLDLRKKNLEEANTSSESQPFQSAIEIEHDRAKHESHQLENVLLRFRQCLQIVCILALVLLVLLTILCFW